MAVQITINSIDYDIPFFLSEITLNQCNDYYEKYGLSLDKKLLEITNRNYTGENIEEQKNNDIENHIDQKAMAWVAFWTGYDIKKLKNFPHMDPVLKKYRELYQLLADENELIGFDTEVEWNNEIWSLRDFTNLPLEQLDKNQRKIIERSISDLKKVKENHWDNMIFPLGVYFRKKRENVKELLIYPENDPDRFPSLRTDRIELLKEVPMNYVKSVANFLLSLMGDPEAIISTIKNPFSVN